ncbi:MAG TPA: hypothetical protein VMQ65_03500 [Candidatus Limnocylindria bacterium]|nr:hypothetical protein [Candidatus Limnocylindria bacterium]
MTEYADNPVQLQHAAELRQTSDLFMQRLDRLHDLESRKRELPPDEAEFVRLAREIEDLSRALLHTGGQQVELAEVVHHQAKRNHVAVDQPIRDTPPRRDAVAVLADWRAAERRLSAAAEGSEDEDEARADVERLREEYRRLTNPTPGTVGPSGVTQA